MIGIDLSLTGTAYAYIMRQNNGYGTESPIKAETIDTRKSSGRYRRKWIADKLFDLPGRDFCIEGLAFSRNDPSAQERAGLWFRVVDDFLEHGCRVIVVPPTTLKKFVTGKGNAEKSLMIREVYKRWGFDAADDNQADAVGLLQVGRAVIGELTDLTKPQLEVVAALRKQK